MRERIAFLSRGRGVLIVFAVALFVAGISLPAREFILGGDAPWPELNPAAAMAQRAHSWGDYAGFGEDNAFNRPLIPIAAFDRSLESIGISPIGVNHLDITLLLLVQALAAVRLFFEMFPRSRRCTVAVAFVGCAALLNPYVLLTLHTPYPALALGIAAAAGLIAAALAFLRSGRIRFLVEFLLWSVVAVPANMNPAYVIEHATLIALVGFVVLVRALDRRVIVGRLAQIALLYASVNAWLWLPMMHYASTAFGSLASAGQTYTIDTLNATSAFSQLQNVVRLVGGYLFFNPVGGVLYIPAGPTYVSNAIVIVATLGLPALAAASLWLSKLSPSISTVRAVFAVAIVALFLSKGTSAPVGGIFAWMSTHLPLFSAFRDPFGKFGWILLLCYALLAGESLAAVERRFSARNSIAIAAAAFVLLAVAAYPILGGRLFWQQAAVAVPERYAVLGQWMQSQPPGSRYVQLPAASVLFEAYDWGYVGAGLNSNFSDRSIVTREYDFAQPGTLAIEDLSQHYNETIGASDIAPLLGLYSISHVISDASMNPDYYGSHSDAAPESIPGTHQAVSLGPVRVVRVDRQLTNSRVYAASRLVIGVDTLRQEAISCALSACRGATFLPEAPDVPVGGTADRITFSDAGIRAQSQGEQIFHLIQRDVERANPAADAVNVPTNAVLDYANATVAAADARRSNAGAVVFRGLPPAVIALGAGAPANFTQIFNTAAGAVAPGICSKPGAESVRLVRIPPVPTNRVLALLVRYRTGLAAGQITLSRADGAGGFSVRLHASAAGVAVRLFRVARPTTGLLLFESAIPSARSGCVTVSSVAIGQARSGRTWTLLGAEGNLFDTTPYTALHEAPLDEPAGQRYAGGAASTQGIAPQSALALSAPWSEPEPLQTSLSDMHVVLDNALPNHSYEVRVALRDNAGSPARVAVLSQNNDVLYTAYAPGENGRANVVAAVDNPSGSGRLQVYVYYDPRSFGVTGPVIDEAVAIPMNEYASVGWARGRAMPVPAALQVKATGNAFEISVSGAPAEYVLTLNDSFSKGWLLEAPSGVTARHFVANLYENGWLVHGPGTYRITLAYDGNAYVRDGIVATIVLLVAAALAGAAARLIAARA